MINDCLDKSLLSAKLFNITNLFFKKEFLYVNAWIFLLLSCPFCFLIFSFINTQLKKNEYTILS